MLVGDAVNALQLVGVPCSYDYLLRVLVAIPLDSGKLPDTTEEDLVEDNRVVGLSSNLAILLSSVMPMEKSSCADINTLLANLSSKTSSCVDLTCKEPSLADLTSKESSCADINALSGGV